jgi:ATP/maltotriose-dependent transcriptional regulator MalT
MLAACLNALQQHERAKQVCEVVLARLAPGDSDFPAMNLGVYIELAHAEAGLGQVEQACARLEQLLARHQKGEGPLTLGALHEALARVALKAGDRPASERHAAEMQRHYLATGLPSLVARCESFARETRRVFPSEGEAEANPFDRTTGRFELGPTLLERALAQTDHGSAKAERVLRAMASELGEVEGALFTLREEEVHCAAAVGEHVLAPELSAWLSERLRRMGNDDVTETDFVDLSNPIDPDVFELDGRRYRLFVLSAVGNTTAQYVGAAVLAEPDEGRRVIGNAMLHSVAQWLMREHVGTTSSSLVPPDADA